MTDFKHIVFRWSFRTYQQRVLDRAEQYLNDGKINIVAAPGSGKTILGLELIRRMESPCLILSPTTTIKYQWASRFEQAFMPDNEKIESYFSYDLYKPSLLTTITYQALYSAMKKVRCESDDEIVDYSDIDLFRVISEHNIKTICLDEAHHLQNEWQKALEMFVGGLNKDIRIISLTATPPYDANPAEWERYLNVCGEIDEEIFVPELVADCNLCPHQDYIYFNYPTEIELESFKAYRIKAGEAIEKIANTDIFSRVYDNILSHANDYDFLYSNTKGIVSLLSFCRYCKIEVSGKLIRELTLKNNLPELNPEFAEVALQFLLDSEIICSDSDKDTVRELLKSASLMEKGKVFLSVNTKMKRQLASSVGKLDSIAAITEAESHNLGGKLRMLILTDYIRKETIDNIGSDRKLTDISIVSIFETVRRLGVCNPVGVVSGSLILLPTGIITDNSKWKNTPIAETGYSIYQSTVSNKEKVETVSRLFESGKIQILIGTKSLLGEGWDSPCINTLILASFVGSFMLSNQMRGRAIRIDKQNPDKVANIWHLVTLQPDYIFESNPLKRMNICLEQDDSRIISDDFDTLVRRFECFVGPHYETGEIENGIDRISVLKPPYNASGIASINQTMLKMAAERSDIGAKWRGAVSGGSALHTVNEIPSESRIPAFTFIDVLQGLVLLTFEIGLITLFRSVLNTLSLGGLKFAELVLLAVAICIAGYFSLKLYIKITVNSNPQKNIKNITKAVLKTLQRVNMLSPSANIKIVEGKFKEWVNLSLSGATVHEQNIFNTAITELLSPIDNPRYILIMKKFGKKAYTYSYACPSVVGQRKEWVQIFTDELKGKIGNFEIIYTRNENGRREILKCRRKSHISKIAKMLKKKKRVCNFE